MKTMEDLIMTNDADSPGNSPSSGTALRTPEARLTSFLESRLSSLGYELVAIELLNHREKKLCIYMDLLADPVSGESAAEGVTLEDCVRVTRELDEPLESEPSIAEIFKGAYELEVSSPGIDRPLRKPVDFERFAGEIARITTVRPLSGDETADAAYSAKNPKQKNFYGILRGFDGASASILIGLIAEDGTRGKPGKKKEPKPETPIRIPLALVAKANLEREVKGL
jgi:ribosome maturation factor RimP